MKPLLLLSLVLLLFSCAPKKRVEKSVPAKPVYHMPVKGEPVLSGRGLFIRAKCGDYVRAVEAGRVVYAGKDIGSYGWVIIVRQDDGYASVYGRLSRRWVFPGERVKRRQIIGEVGRTKGRCGVYYELRNSLGDPVPPVLR